MNETPDNSTDPAFLMSRVLDEVLSEVERTRLEEALASSESLRTEAEQFRSVDRLIKQWGKRRVELDWDHHWALTCSQAAVDGAEADVQKLDCLLKQWNNTALPLDGERFAEAVMARIDPRRARRSRYRLVFRVAAPLAAAAAVVFALTSGFWPTRPPKSEVVFGRPGAAVPMSTAVVSFARGPAVQVGAGAGVSFGSVGATPMSATQGEVPPL